MSLPEYTFARCMMRWEDTPQLIAADPHMSRFQREKTDEVPWSEYAEELVEAETALLGATQNAYLTAESRPLWRPNPNAPVSLAPFGKVTRLEFSSKYAFICASMPESKAKEEGHDEKNKKSPGAPERPAVHLFRADVTMQTPECTSTSLMEAPKTANVERERLIQATHTLLQRTDVFSKSNAYYEPLPGGQLDSHPSHFRVDLESGVLAVITERSDGRTVLVFDGHAQRGAKTAQLARIELPAANRPHNLSCSSHYLAVSYNNVENDSGERLPPHVLVYSVMTPEARPACLVLTDEGAVRAYAEAHVACVRACAGDTCERFRGRGCETNTCVPRVASLSFHESHPNVLYVALENGEVCGVLITEHEKGVISAREMNPKNRLRVLPTPTELADAAARLQVEADQEKDEARASELRRQKLVMLEMSKNAEPVMYVSARRVGIDGVVAETRMVLLGENSIAFINGDSDNAPLKISQGKLPRRVVHLPVPMYSACNAGNIVALRRASDDAICLVDLCTTKPSDPITLNRVDEAGRRVSWSRTVLTTAKRVCALEENGGLVFYCVMNDSFRRRLTVAREAAAARLASAAP